MVAGGDLTFFGGDLDVRGGGLRVKGRIPGGPGRII